MTNLRRSAATAALAVSLCFAGVSGWQWRAERVWAGRVASEVRAAVTGDTDPRARVDALARMVDARLSRPRVAEPFLRWSAMEFWQAGRGECAAGARVMIIVLDALGIDAHRIILPDLGHTTFIYRDGGSWRVAPGIRGPERWTDLTADHPRMSDLFQIDHGDVLRIRGPVDRYSLWNWSRLFGDVVEVNQLRPFPHWLVMVFETPSLFAAVVWALLAVFIAALAFFNKVTCDHPRRVSAQRDHVIRHNQGTIP